MTPFEQELKRALTRRGPGEDFTRQVMARIDGRAESRPKNNAAPARSVWASIFGWRPVFAALLTIALLTGMLYQRRLEREKGEAAKRQLMTALHIAGAQLREAQLRVKRMEFPEVVMQ